MPPPVIHTPIQSASSNRQPELSTSIHRVFIEQLGNHLDEALRAELYKQLGDRISIVTDKEDADAILGGLSQARNNQLGDPSGFHDNATGSLSLYDRTHKIILWSGNANDHDQKAFWVKHGGEQEVAERLVEDLKDHYFNAKKKSDRPGLSSDKP